MFWKEVFADAGGRGGAVGRLTAVLVAGTVFGVPVLIGISHFGDLHPWLSDLLELTPQGTDLWTRWKRFQGAMGDWVRVGTGVVGALMLLAAAVRGAGAVTGERERDTWVSLVSTPLTAREMLNGKWWGCVLGLRPFYLLLAVMWGVGVVTGAVHPLTLPFLVVATAVYVSAFAWLGIFFSLSCRTTLAATVRAIAAAGFLGFGYLFAFGLCCVMPLTLGGVSRGAGELLQDLFQLMVGASPPIVLGWLPLNEFTRREMEPFAWGEHEPLFGPLAPVIGVVGWGLFAGWLAIECHQRFRVMTNRGLRWRTYTEAGRPSE